MREIDNLDWLACLTTKTTMKPCCIPPNANEPWIDQECVERNGASQFLYTSGVHPFDDANPPLDILTRALEALWGDVQTRPKHSILCYDDSDHDEIGSIDRIST